MKKILLPTDFSENSYNALKYAVQLFGGEPCVFFLLHTYTPVLYDSEYMLHSLSEPNFTISYKQNSEQKLGRLKTRITKEFPNKNHEFRKISSFNNLGEEIREQVYKTSADLVVMGTKGATGAKKILFGSNTVYAMNKVTCPLLAIPSGYEYESPKEILFPTDYGVQFSRNSLEILFQIAAGNNSGLHILHVDLGIGLNEQQKEKRAILQEHLYKKPHLFHTWPAKNVSQGIREFQKNNPIDLLVMINNKHSFFENLLFRPVIDELGFNVKVPFLVLPSNLKKKESGPDSRSENHKDFNYSATIN